MSIKARTEDIDPEKISEMLETLFSRWGLREADQLVMLGLDSENHNSLYSNRGIFALDRDKLERAHHFFEIHKSLRLLLLDNQELIYSWISQPNQAFKGVSPIQLIGEQGMLGIYMIRTYLNHHINS